MVNAQYKYKFGNKYLKVFSEDFILKEGKLSDDQALKIISLLKKNSKNSRIDKSTYLLYDEIDSLYKGGKYHGSILCLIFDNYLKIAFGTFHSPIKFKTNFVQKFAYYKYYNIGNRNSKTFYYFSVKTTTKVIPSFKHPTKFTHTVKHSYEGEYKDRNDLKQSFSSRNFWGEENRKSNIQFSAFISAKNLLEIPTKIASSVSKDDRILSEGIYDFLLISILRKYITTTNTYSKELADIFYSELAYDILELIYSDTKSFYNTIDRYGIKLEN